MAGNHIVIADHRSIMREAISVIVNEMPHMQVSYKITSKSRLIRQLPYCKEEVVIMGFPLKHKQEIQTVNKGLAQSQTRLMYIAEESSRSQLYNLMALQLNSYVLTRCGRQELEDAVRAAAYDGYLICQQILNRLALTPARLAEERKEKRANCDPVQLSEREIEVIQLIAQEYASREIAEELYLSEYTVMTHRKNIMKKIGVNNVAGLIKFAVRRNIVRPARL